MNVYNRLRQSMLPRAEGIRVETLGISLDYTCARTSDGGKGGGR